MDVKQHFHRHGTLIPSYENVPLLQINTGNCRLRGTHAKGKCPEARHRGYN